MKHFLLLYRRKFPWGWNLCFTRPTTQLFLQSIRFFAYGKSIKNLIQITYVSSAFCLSTFTGMTDSNKRPLNCLAPISRRGRTLKKSLFNAVLRTMLQPLYIWTKKISLRNLILWTKILWENLRKETLTDNPILQGCSFKIVTSGVSSLSMLSS